MENFDSSIIEPIEMRMVKPSPFEVRHKIDKKGSEFRSLVKSISEHGLLQPILVRPVAHGFEIVAGYMYIIYPKYGKYPGATTPGGGVICSNMLNTNLLLGKR